MTHKPMLITLRGLIFISLILLLGPEGHAIVNTSMKITSPQALEEKEADKGIQTIDIDRYKIELDSLSPGQTLSSVMVSQGIDNQTIYKASRKANNILKTNEIPSGVAYIVVRQTKAPFNIMYLILDVLPDRSVVFEFEKSVEVYWGKVKTKKHSKRVAGKIQSSFWITMKRHGVKTKHILQLMALFNSRIKFDKMTTQDRFDITFEDHKINDTVVQTGEILSILMDVNGEKISAFRFEHHGLVSYYDETGKNLSSAFLDSPVQYKKITSRFSDKRAHPILKKSKRHPATDFGAPEGTPVMSIGNGVIKKIGYSKTAGNFIEVNHTALYESRYLHLSAIADGIQDGLQIKKGNVIGYVGSTGIATGPHLDFRISKNGQFIDFLSHDLPKGKPVDKDCFEAFLKIVNKYTKGLKIQANT